MRNLIKPPTREAIWSRNAARSLTTARTEAWYRSVFRLNDDEVFLDLGSGKSEFAPPNIVRTDYIYRKHNPGRGINVACLFQRLPFRDGKFDHITAGWSLYWVGNGIEESVGEALRVLRPGGTLQIYPTKPKEAKHAEPLEASGTTRLDKVDYKRSLQERVGDDTIVAVGGAVMLGLLRLGNLAGLHSPVPDDLALSMGGAAIGIFLNEFGDKIFGEDQLLTVTRSEEMSNPEARIDIAQQLTAAYKFGGKRPW